MARMQMSFKDGGGRPRLLPAALRLEILLELPTDVAKRARFDDGMGYTQLLVENHNPDIDMPAIRRVFSGLSVGLTA